MTLHTTSNRTTNPPPQTQYQQNHSCYCPDSDQTLKEGSWINNNIKKKYNNNNFTHYNDHNNLKHNINNNNTTTPSTITTTNNKTIAFGL